jgi:hypothetical protein
MASNFKVATANLFIAVFILSGFWLLHYGLFLLPVPDAGDFYAYFLAPRIASKYSLSLLPIAIPLYFLSMKSEVMYKKIFICFLCWLSFLIYSIGAEYYEIIRHVLGQARAGEAPGRLIVVLKELSLYFIDALLYFGLFSFLAKSSRSL